MNITARIKAVQSNLGLTVDGIAGPKTWEAIYEKIVGNVDLPPDTDLADERTEGNIKDLLPPVKQMARALVHAAAERGITIKVLSGYRSYEEQAKLYAKYKAGGPQAASPGNSAHNFNIGFDIGVFKGAKYLGEGPEYKVVGTLGRGLGLYWGADFGDEPHFAYRPPWARSLSEGAMMKELRRRHEADIPYWD
jgi:peptidoglycan L-alanyl-D-glutamate endopeptidase CwlK